MADIRRIKKVFRSTPTIEGAGVHLKRAFGFYQVPQLDPFLLFDDFCSHKPEEYLAGFPWHPHRGIETITYVLAGRVEHGDSMGNKGVIAPGDVQWMTAGGGIIHQEMPTGDERGRMCGFQLWANLPASRKMMEPRYRGITAAEIPAVRAANDIEVKVICGEYQGMRGPVQDIVTDPTYFDVGLPRGVTWTHAVKPTHTVLAYVYDGAAHFDKGKDPYAYTVEGVNYFDFKRECLMQPGSLVLYGDGDEFAITTREQPVRFLLVSGKPLGEPVAWYGPIVMNTEEELRVAFEEYNNGTFLKHTK